MRRRPGCWRSWSVVWRMRRSGFWRRCALVPAATRSVWVRGSAATPTGAHRPVGRGGDDTPAEGSSRAGSDAPHPGPAAPDLGREPALRPRDRPGPHQPGRPAGGRLGFTHPLLGSTVYAEATTHARRSVHRRLAELVDDPEERARHLALAASGPHIRVARALEEA